MNSLFCFGLGYSAGLVAKQLSADGWRIAGTSTTQAGVHAITQEGYQGYLFDGTLPSVDVRPAVKEATHILLSIPPGSGGDPAFVLHGADIAASASVRWIGYFSTVGVYGDTRGGWVDEEVPAEPGSWRGQQRLSAENDWRRLGRETGKAVNVLRLPGIYGPGRSAVDDVMAGTARSIVKPGQVFNRIHVADIAAAVIAAMARAERDRVYNITDDEPGPPQDVVAYAAELLGAPPPPMLDFETANLSPMARSFYSECKRVRNARMKAELLPHLAYPTYREGIAAIAAAYKK
jgi:nucleoside-diphosphate-sugar epimerase